MKNENPELVKAKNLQIIEKIYNEQPEYESNTEVVNIPKIETQNNYDFAETVEEDESLLLQDKEVELIKRSLEKHKKRKLAAKELGISERTLYRKIKQYDL